MRLKRIWRDQRGFVATTDLILIGTIVVLGTIVGLATLRNSVVQEFGDLATALGRLNQSYSYSGNEFGDANGVNGAGGRMTILFELDPDPSAYAKVPGSSYTDQPDFCDGEDEDGKPPAGISVTVPPIDEGQALGGGGQGG